MKRLQINTLEKGWCDPCNVYLHACFQCLCDFFEKDSWYIIDWDYGEETKDAFETLRELYYWWVWEYDDDIYDSAEYLWAETQDQLERLTKYRQWMWS